MSQWQRSTYRDPDGPPVRVFVVPTLTVQIRGGWEGHGIDLASFAQSTIEIMRTGRRKTIEGAMVLALVKITGHKEKRDFVPAVRDLKKRIDLGLYEDIHHPLRLPEVVSVPVVTVDIDRHTRENLVDGLPHETRGGTLAH